MPVTPQCYFLPQGTSSIGDAMSLNLSISHTVSAYPSFQIQSIHFRSKGPFLKTSSRWHRLNSPLIPVLWSVIKNYSVWGWPGSRGGAAECPGVAAWLAVPEKASQIELLSWRSSNQKNAIQLICLLDAPSSWSRVKALKALPTPSWETYAFVFIL